VVLQPHSILEKIRQHDLALTCAWRLRRKGPRDELLRFFVKRLDEFRQDRKDASNKEWFSDLGRRIQEIHELTAQLKRKEKT
jgi:hypothetical protein